MSNKILPEGKNLVYKNTNRPSYFKGNTGEFEHAGPVNSIAMDDQYIVAGTGGWDKKVIVRNRTSGEVVQYIVAGSGGWDNKVIVRNRTSGEVVQYIVAGTGGWDKKVIVRNRTSSLELVVMVITK